MMLAMALPLLVGLQVAGAAVGGVGGGRKFNVLLMLSDDLRPELGAFGAAHIHSPAIDELASRSLVLAANFVQQSVRRPTRSSRNEVIHLLINLTTHRIKRAIS